MAENVTKYDMLKTNDEEKQTGFDAGEKDIRLSTDRSFTTQSSDLSSNSGFEETEEDIVFYNCDRYGFLKDVDANREGKQVEDTVISKRRDTEENRTKKWIKMLGKWNEYRENKPKKVKRRIRKGVPDCLRGLVWNLLSGIGNLKANNSELYEELCARDDSPSDSIYDTIEADIHRTFPNHEMFKEKMSEGQMSLRRILHSYSRYDPEVGYCQGMGFITATFLMYMPEEEAFWQLVSVMQQPPTKIRELYLPGLPFTQKALFVYDGVIRIHLNKLYQHFTSQSIATSMFAQNWIMCFFTYNYNYDMVTRIWDIFLAEGWKIVYRTGLALLKEAEPDLLRKDFENCLHFFRSLPSRIDGHQLIENSFKIPLKTAQIKELEQEYDDQQLG
mmetsp:Transcript_1807/g.2464  ORF Transcript_1807/g.2464 Transcript_1807/m.2464 type:complete len:388 (-) Transcript_1807:180-1343(-)